MPNLEKQSCAPLVNYQPPHENGEQFIIPINHFIKLLIEMMIN